jgi:hypothetical protein
MCSYQLLRVNSLVGVRATLLLLANASWAATTPARLRSRWATAPYSGPTLLYSLQEDDWRLLQESECRGGHQRPQDQVHQLSGTLNVGEEDVRATPDALIDEARGSS